MRIRWQPFDRNEAPLGAICGAVLALAGSLAAVWVALGFPRVACPLRAATGLSCPTCGTTRLIEALLRGDVSTAFAWNPLVFLLLCLVTLWACGSALRRLFAWPKPTLVNTAREGVWLRAAIVVVLLCGWAYVIARP